MTTQDKVLRIEDLRVYYWTPRGPVRAVDGINFSLNRGERFAFVGESGCGKSTTAMSILRMIKPPGNIEGGRIILDGQDTMELDKEGMRQIRWSKVSLIPQGAMNSLNPVMRIREQIGDAIMTHEEGVSEEAMRSRIRDLLVTVELDPDVADMYPHELSGGMKQRACIAMAIVLQPQLIIADEPTSALDVVVQKAVMQTLIGVQERLDASLILIGHDMGLMAQVADRIGVMYAGHLVEVADVITIYEDSLHPYTRALISSLPSLEERRDSEGIPGLPPFLLNPPPGCVFHPRCPEYIGAICEQKAPVYHEVRPEHWVACHLYPVEE